MEPSRRTAKHSPEVAQKIADYHRTVVDDVAAAVETHKVVVVGMAQNPFVKRARKALTGANIPFTYLEYGSYLSKWKERLALKLWASFPTFPMVFVDGALAGGATDIEKLIEAGKLKA